MSETVTEKASIVAGVETSTRIVTGSSRLLFPRRAVNRSFINSSNETRPPFAYYTTDFQSPEDEFVFQNSAISGSIFYRASPPSFSAYLIVAVGDRILAGSVRNKHISFINIYTGIDPSYHNSYFCQALNILVFQNGSSYPLYWQGNPTEKMQYTFDSTFVPGKAMPIGNFMAYAFGRIFVATPQDLVYASDYIYSQEQSINGRQAVLSFRESEYPSSGDGFGSPMELGRTTGITVMPRSGDIQGYGDIFLLCENGAYTISPGGIPRNQWTSADMVKIGYVGGGCSSNESIVYFNNLPYYRSVDGKISSILGRLQAYTSKTAYSDPSRPVAHYLAYDDDSSDIKYAMSCCDGSRMLHSALMVKEKSIHQGVHRYGLGLISCCSQVNGSGQSSNAWEGLWTGPRPAAMIEAVIGQTQKAIIISHDTDGINRIYELSNRGNFDTTKDGKRKIKGSIVYGNIFYPDSLATTLTTKKLTTCAGLLTESNGTVKFQYAPDHTDTFFDIDTDLSFDGPGLGSMKFKTMDPCSKSRKDTSTMSSSGICFDFRIICEGTINFSGLEFNAVLSSINSGNKCLVSRNPAISLPPSGNVSYQELTDYVY